MSIEIKQVHKLSQQLVMTPQLQQAIKLLQLSRMELVDLVREEMMENPILEDGVDTAQELGKDDPDAEDGERGCRARPSCRRRRDERATHRRSDRATSSTAESQAVNEIDWDNYIESYSSAPSMPSYKPSTTSCRRSSRRSPRRPRSRITWSGSSACRNWPTDEENVGMLIIGNLDSDGYLKEPPLADIADEARGAARVRRDGAAQAPGLRSRSACARARCRSACSSRRATSAPTTRSSSR